MLLMRIILAQIILGCLFSTLSFSQSGVLDPAFFDQGTLLMFENAGEFPFTVAEDFIQDSDGNFRVCGRSTASPTTNNFFTLKFNASGELDPNYGTNGVKYYPESGPLFGVSSIRQLPNGNFVVLTGEITGGPGNNSTVLRILEMDANGDLVDGFGNGNNTFTIQGNISNEQLDISPQGKIWVHFNKINQPNIFTVSANIYCIQFNTNGTLNTQFGSSGLFEYGGEQEDERTFSIEFDANDNAYLCGGFKASSNFGVFSEAMVVKVLNNGVLDNNFGTNGIYKFNDGNSNFSAWDAKISNNDLYLCGFRYSPEESLQNAMILKMNISGSLNTSFGNSGFTLLNQSVSSFKSMALSDEGQIAVLGELDNSSTNEKDILIALYSSSGSLQQSFGTGGISTPWDLNNGDDYADKILFSNNNSGIYISGGGFSNNDPGGGGGSRSPEDGDYAFIQKYGYDDPTLVLNFNSTDLLIFPNPAEEKFQIRSNSPGFWQLHDISGRQVKHGQHFGGDQTISVSDLPTGSYLLYFQDKNGGRSVSKLMH